MVCEALQVSDEEDAELLLGGCGVSKMGVTASCSPASCTTLASSCVTGTTASSGGYIRPISGAVDSRLATVVIAESACSIISGAAATATAAGGLISSGGAAGCGGLGSSSSATGGGISIYARGLRCVSGPVVLRPNQPASPGRDQAPAAASVLGQELGVVGGASGGTPCFASHSSRGLFGVGGGGGAGGGGGGRLLGCALAQLNSDIAAALASMQQQMQVSPLMQGAVLVAAVDELPTGSRTLLQFIQNQCSHAGPPEPAAAGPGNPLGHLRLLVSYSLQIARGMEYLHAQGQAHGSLSPCAVYMAPVGEQQQQQQAAAAAAAAPEGGGLGSGPASPRGALCPPMCCKIALTGLVNPTERANRLAIHPGEWGPVSYIAPECFSGGGSGGCASAASAAGRALSGVGGGGLGTKSLMRVDVNAYGALLYHLFIGVAPFHQYHPAQVLVGLASGGLQLQWPQPYVGRRPPVPDAIRSLVLRCMAHTPVARPTFHEIVGILECVAQTL
ncbi:hypothetical protein HXX76_004367 [Chlamydomonas incerta]|uniref:Protein kinase domain-containing protein n=1 Tax=Chlamydomonas incerta TaxID=51695 RepID=A0A835TM60_CHLIN|nr:hypothetical protein HXX76_004367 [Chlamydomonas incerta]|eukprot:KAG2440255.1 hypothetical protein HXX76_004367 [Chlamydomonas incerta]